MADESLMDIKLLISLIEQRPVLWDKTTELYKNRAATQAAWREVTAALNPDFETHDEDIKHAYAKLAMQRWTHVRDNYHKFLKKTKEQKKLGGNTKRVKPYIYCKHLRFMRKVLQPNESDASIENKNKETENREENVYNYERLQTQPNNMSMPKQIISQAQKGPTSYGMNPVDIKIVKNNDPKLSQEPEVTNRHLSFFKGVLPTLANFSDDEVLEFQMGVLQLLKKIKHSRQSLQFTSTCSISPSSSQIGFEQNIIKQEYPSDATQMLQSSSIIKIEPDIRDSDNSPYSNFSE